MIFCVCLLFLVRDQPVLGGWLVAKREIVVVPKICGSVVRVRTMEDFGGEEKESLTIPLPTNFREITWEPRGGFGIGNRRVCCEILVGSLSI